MTLKSQIDRFSQNEENFNAIITGSAGTTVDLGDAGVVKSVATVIGEIAPGVDRGSWVTTTAYVINDIVFESGAYYRCRENHTSGTFATDLSAGKWRLNQGGDSTILTHRGRTLDDVITARFDNVTQMIADVNLAVGDVVETFANQNGAAIKQEWKIVAAATGTDDGGSYIDLTGSGLQAKQIFGSSIFIEHFGGGVTLLNNSPAGQAFLNYLQSVSESKSYIDASSNYYNSHVSFNLKENGVYNFLDELVVVSTPTNKRFNIKIKGNSGATIKGVGTNNFIDFNNRGSRCVIEDLLFVDIARAVKFTTNNKNECSLSVNNVRTINVDTFLDTGSYVESRSTMISFDNCFFTEGTRRVCNLYTDHATFTDCWFYAKKLSPDAALYLSGDGVVSFKSCFFIPHGVQYSPKEDTRFIDFVCDSAQSSPNDRSIKTLKITDCRMSLESARGFIWTYDNNAALPSGEQNTCASITIEDSYIGGLGGLGVVHYKTGYPASVTLRNTKVLSSTGLITVDAGNTTPPTPTDVVNGISTHVISIDEATRLAQGKSGNTILTASLMPFLYDTTTQTSKFKRSIQANIDYRLPSVDASAGAGAKKVKVTIPVLFDHLRTANTPNRDLLTFMIVTVTDALGRDASVPVYSASAVTLVTVTGGFSGSAIRRIKSTVIQDATGGSTFTSSASPTSIHWGDGDTGSADISGTSNTGVEDKITVVWGGGSTPSVCWAYIIPLAGVRENYWGTYRQFGVW